MKYIVLGTKGEFKTLETVWYDTIVEEIGSPFSTAAITPGIMAYIRDEGLFDGSEPNMAAWLCFGAPICGPVLLFGGADREGNSAPLDLSADRQIMIRERASFVHELYRTIERNREQPFTVFFLEGENHG